MFIPAGPLKAAWKKELPMEDKCCSRFARTVLGPLLAVTMAACGPVALAGSSPFGRTTSASMASSTNAGDTGQTGSWAREFLTASPYTSLVVTVDYVPGEMPSPAALSLLQARLTDLCHKPDGVSVLIGSPIAGNASGVYADSDVVALAASNRKLHASGTTLALYVLYLDGRSALTNPNAACATLGRALQATSFCVFRETVLTEASSIGSSPLEVEAAVLLHETGHILGLVDFGTPLTSAHEDLQHPNHCTDPACVMSWLMTGSNAGSAGLASIDFDPACRADLRANGGN
jgi:hypothetical protein